MISIKIFLFTFISCLAFTVQALEINFNSKANAGKFLTGLCSNIAR